MHRPELADDLHAGDVKLARLMAGAPRSYAGGKTIIVAERENSFVYRLRSGWCGRLRHLRDGRTQMLGVLLPGDLFGVRSMFVEEGIDEVVALDEVTVDALDERQARQAAKHDWQVSLRLTWQILEDERRLHNWMIGIGRGSAEEKLALMLLDLRGRLALAGVIEQDATEIPLPMTQNHIGELLGLTSVHVNRTVKRFRELGLARFSRGMAVIDDLPALTRIAYPMLDIYEKRRPEFGCAAA